MPIIPITEETEKLAQAKMQDPILKISKAKSVEVNGSSDKECLPSRHVALSSNRTTKLT
jgi:hypothetical protein